MSDKFRVQMRVEDGGKANPGVFAGVLIGDLVCKSLRQQRDYAREDRVSTGIDGSDHVHGLRMNCSRLCKRRTKL